jgi:hypothetical protein
VALSPFQRKVIVVATLLVVIRVLFPVRGDCSIRYGLLDCWSISYVPGIYYDKSVEAGVYSHGAEVRFSWGEGIFLWRHTLAHVVAILLIAGMLFVVFPNGLSFTRPKD